jgi:hypothetical protein
MNMRLLLFSIFAGGLFSLSGCVSPTAVDYDHSAAAKFSNYKCFAIDSREARSNYQDVVLSPIVDRRIERAIVSELQAKGFTQNCPKPDFRVTFNTITKTRTEINDFGVHSRYFHRYPYYGYRGYSEIDIDQYEQGTFIVDIIDESTKELVWRGAYTKRLGWSAPTEVEVQKIIGEILAKFPPGSAQQPD